jgi:hypothetical protein
MERITITISNFDNEAMAIAPDQAVYDILQKLADKVGNGSIHSLPSNIKDSNGNNVGSVVVHETYCKACDCSGIIAGHNGASKCPYCC